MDGLILIVHFYDIIWWPKFWFVKFKKCVMETFEMIQVLEQLNWVRYLEWYLFMSQGQNITGRWERQSFKNTNLNCIKNLGLKNNIQCKFYYCMKGVTCFILNACKTYTLIYLIEHDYFCRNNMSLLQPSHLPDFVFLWIIFQDEAKAE